MITVPSLKANFIDSPQNTRLIAIRSTSLNLTWERPDWNGTIIEYLSTCSSDGGTFHNANVPSPTSHDIYSIHLNALSPHTTYTCCVTASTTHGVSSHSACDTQTTLEDGIVAVLKHTLCNNHHNIFVLQFHQILQ